MAMTHFFPYFYGLVALILLFQAYRVMSGGWIEGQGSKKFQPFLKKNDDDRTGRVTIHPELLNQEGRITDEDLLTVRFSKDIDPPQSIDSSDD